MCLILLVKASLMSLKSTFWIKTLHDQTVKILAHFASGFFQRDPGMEHKCEGTYVRFKTQIIVLLESLLKTVFVKLQVRQR